MLPSKDIYEQYPIVRTDLHLERYPIFSPSQTFARREISSDKRSIIVQPYQLIIGGPELEREYRQRSRTTKKKENGSDLIAEGTYRDLIVERVGEEYRGELNLGTLTAFDLRTLYLLHAEAFDHAYRLWSEQKREKSWDSVTDALGWVLAEGSIPFSIRSICKRLNLSAGGKTQLPYLRSIQRLGGCNIQWGGLYERSDRTFIQRGEIFRILNRVAWEQALGDASSGGTRGCFTFNPDIVRNIARRLCRPARLEVICQLKTEIGLLLYNHLDRLSFKRPGPSVKIELSTKELVEDLGLEGEHYESPGRRYRQLQVAVNELKGKRYHTQQIEEISISRPRGPKQDATIEVLLLKDSRQERRIEAESEQLLESLERAQDQQRARFSRELANAFEGSPILVSIDAHSSPAIIECKSNLRISSDPSLSMFSKNLVKSYAQKRGKGLVCSSKDEAAAEVLISKVGKDASRFIDFVLAQNWVPDSFAGAVTSYSESFLAELGKRNEQSKHKSLERIARKKRVDVEQSIRHEELYWKDRMIVHYNSLSDREKQVFDDRAISSHPECKSALSSALTNRFSGAVIEKLKELARVNHYRQTIEGSDKR